MSSTVQTPQPYVSGLTPAGPNIVNVIRSEWTKIWSVRSTMWTLLIGFVLTVGLGALICWGTEANYSHLHPADKATLDPTSISLAGLVFGQLALAVFGVLFISSEYSTGGIRTTLTAVPQRVRLLTAKAIVLLVISLVVGMVSSFVAFFIGQAFLSRVGIEAHLGDPDVMRAVIGGGLYLMASAMFGFALGALLRHSAAGISLAIALLLVVPPLTNLLPGDWGHWIEKYFTSNAGQQITSVLPQGDALSPWAGYAVFTLWWLVILVIAGALMSRRDA
ncbi:MAG TPA: ABC transporter permease [Candidatus Nanopelagicales bacterium]|jgi:ABC-type transport system involved in multi-copper enzyme maturation permease subunit